MTSGNMWPQVHQGIGAPLASVAVPLPIHPESLEWQGTSFPSSVTHRPYPSYGMHMCLTSV